MLLQLHETHLLLFRNQPSRAAQKASAGLDVERANIYCDLMLSSLSEAARQTLTTMDARSYVYCLPARLNRLCPRER